MQSSHLHNFCVLVDVAILVSHLLAFEILCQELLAIVIWSDWRSKIEDLRKAQSLSFGVESSKQQMVKMSRYVCKMDWHVRFLSL